MFLYHHAAARPPNSADAAATAPSLSQRWGGVAGGCETGEETDSKGFVIFVKAYQADISYDLGLIESWTLDAGGPEKDNAQAGIIISIFVFDFNPIYAMVYIFQ